MRDCDAEVMELFETDINYLLADSMDKIDKKLAMLGPSKKSRLGCLEQLQSEGVDVEAALNRHTPIAAASKLKIAVYNALIKSTKDFRRSQ